MGSGRPLQGSRMGSGRPLHTVMAVAAASAKEQGAAGPLAERWGYGVTAFSSSRNTPTVFFRADLSARLAVRTAGEWGAGAGAVAGVLVALRKRAEKKALRTRRFSGAGALYCWPPLPQAAWRGLILETSMMLFARAKSHPRCKIIQPPRDQQAQPHSRGSPLYFG